MTVDEFKKEKEIMKSIDPEYKPLTDEMYDYVRNHGVYDINFDDYDIITLFPPINKEKYMQYVRTNIKKYESNSIKKEDHGLYYLYYLNKPTELDKLDEMNERIGKEILYPFKISADLCFIVEDSKEVEIVEHIQK